MTKDPGKKTISFRKPTPEDLKKGMELTKEKTIEINKKLAEIRSKGKKWYCALCGAEISKSTKRNFFGKGKIGGRCGSCKRNVEFLPYVPTLKNTLEQEQKEEMDQSKKEKIVTRITKGDLTVEILDPESAWKEIKCYEMTTDFVLQPVCAPLRVKRKVENKSGETETKVFEAMGIILLCIDKDGKREIHYPKTGRFSDSTIYINDQKYKIPSEPYYLKTMPSPGILKRFLDGEIIDGKELWKQMKTYRETYLDIGEDKRKLIVQTAWDLGTHFYMIFKAYPYNNFFGFRGSGKNRAHEVSYIFCFHALMIATSRGISSIFRGIDAMGSTWLKNEAESLIGENKDKDLYEVCLEGYKLQGQVSLTSDDGKNKSRPPIYFDIYSPKSFASDKSIYGAFGTRMIKYLSEKTSGMQGRKDLDLEIGKKIRDDTYLLRLQDGCRISETLQKTPVEDLLKGYDLELVSRDREIFYPILYITKEYASQEEFDDLVAFIKDYLAQQKQESIDQPAAIVLRAIYSLCLDEQKLDPAKEEFWISIHSVREQICYDDPESWRLTTAGGYENKEIIKTSETSKSFSARRIGGILDSLGFDIKRAVNGKYERKINIPKIEQKSRTLNIAINDIKGKDDNKEKEDPIELKNQEALF